MRRRTVGEITRKEWATSIVVAVAGIVNAAGLMVLLTPALLGLNSFWEAFATSALLGAVAFPPLVVTTTNAVSTFVIEITRRNHWLAGVLATIVGEFGLASVTTPLGIGVGLLLWAVFGVALIPAVLIAVGRGGPLTMPHLGSDLIIGYVVYGLSLGGFYGLLVQEHDVRGRVVRAVRPGAATGVE